MKEKDLEKEIEETPPIKVFVGIPSYNKEIFVPCAQGLMNAMRVFLTSNIPFLFQFEIGSPWVSAARNNLAQLFLETDCTDLVFIDSDIGFPPKAFRDLIASPEDVIAGIYPKKQMDECYPVALKTSAGEDGNTRPVVENGVCEADGLPTGFMKIKRHVLEKMIAAYPELEYHDPFRNKKVFDLFGMFVKDKALYGDDYAFCYRWRRIGGRCWALPDITFIHCGQKNFEGNLHQYMLKPQGGPKWTSKKPAE